MDVVSHALWGYASLRWRSKKLARWGLIAGAGPDLTFAGARFVERLSKEGLAGMKFARPPAGIWTKQGPPMPQEWIDAYHNYYIYTHSFVVLGAIGLLWYLWRRKIPWLLLPWALHILLDIPTHERYLTQFLFPLSNWTYEGVTWAHPMIFFGNWFALGMVYLAFYFKYRTPVSR